MAALPERPPREELALKFWENMDNLFHRTIGHAEMAFKVNVVINIVMVIVGIVLLAYSMIYSWINGLNLYSTAFGSLGVIDFVATFYLTPQRKIQETVGDLTQIQIYYRTYTLQWEAVADWQRMNDSNITLEQLKEMNKHLEEITSETAQKIEDFIGKKEQKQ